MTTRSRVARSPIPDTRAWGVALALCTALISGVAIFVNSYAVQRFDSPTVYTTAKNLIAAALLGLLLFGATRAGSPEGFTPPTTTSQRLRLLVVGVIGGGVAFVLFFEGLARASSSDAAFGHKTLVVWVAVLAVAFLHERIGWPHVLAIVFIIAGQIALTNDLSTFPVFSGESLVLGATMLWAIEVVIAKRLLDDLSPLTVGTARLGIGLVVLLGWLAVDGQHGGLVGGDPSQWAWALLTGAILTAYVATWYAALARAQAVDVTAVLVLGAVVTAGLNTAVKGVAIGPDLTGLGLLTLGVVVVALGRRQPGEVSTAT